MRVDYNRHASPCPFQSIASTYKQVPAGSEGRLASELTLKRQKSVAENVVDSPCRLRSACERGGGESAYATSAQRTSCRAVLQFCIKPSPGQKKTTISPSSEGHAAEEIAKQDGVKIRVGSQTERRSATTIMHIASLVNRPCAGNLPPSGIRPFHLPAIEPERPTLCRFHLMPFGAQQFKRFHSPVARMARDEAIRGEQLHFSLFFSGLLIALASPHLSEPGHRASTESP